MGFPPRCRVRNREAFKRLRNRLCGNQATCASDVGISGPTFSRVERGIPVEKTTAVQIFDYLARIGQQNDENIGSFDVWFEEIAPHVYDWDQMMRGAEMVGKGIFHRFQADAVLTFPGPSAIFTNLVIARSLSPDAFLRKSVHMAWFVDKPKPSQAKAFRKHGFSRVDRGTWSILVPRALDGSNRRMRTVAIVDDHIVTGMTLDAVRQHLIADHHYSADRIIGACCVLAPNPVIPWNPRDVRAFVAEKADFSLPWGLPAKSFEVQIRQR